MFQSTAVATYIPGTSNLVAADIRRPVRFGSNRRKTETKGSGRSTSNT